MKTRMVFWGLLVCALQASAGTSNCADIGTRLNDMASKDQQIRQEWNVLAYDSKGTPAEKEALQKRWKIIDGENLKQLKDIISGCGWPVTAKDSHSAWLLAQHADSDLAFQREARARLEVSVQAGIAAARDLAYLSDRIAANEGRPQEYGTQFSQPDRCHLLIEPVDDRAMVNRRRLAVGLQSLEQYEAEARRRFIPADCPGEPSVAQ